MKIEFRSSRTIKRLTVPSSRQDVKKGEVVDLPKGEAQHWIKRGVAVKPRK